MFHAVNHIHKQQTKFCLSLILKATIYICIIMNVLCMSLHLILITLQFTIENTTIPILCMKRKETQKNCNLSKEVIQLQSEKLHIFYPFSVVISTKPECLPVYSTTMSSNKLFNSYRIYVIQRKQGKTGLKSSEINE